MSRQKSKKSNYYKVLNVRGTGGSGKSYLMGLFMEKFKAKPIRGPSRGDDLLDAGGKVEAYHLVYKGHDVYIVGRYETNCGGCDGIKTQDEVCERVKKYAAKGITIFEGFLISGLYSRYYNLSQELGGMVWVYLDTPLEVCIERVGQRNKGKEFNSKNTRSKFLATEASRRRATEAGEEVRVLRHRRVLKDFCKVLDECL